jgi:hypothetical protein
MPAIAAHRMPFHFCPVAKYTGMATQMPSATTSQDQQREEGGNNNEETTS